MKLNESVRKFQEGGPMPSAPAPEQGGQGGGDPLAQLAEAAMQALQTDDCEAMKAVCAGFLQLVQEAMSGSSAPSGAPAQEGQPMYRLGGKISRIRK